MIKLTPRLQSAVDYVRPGHLFADVGTDHAYLPIYLCQAGRLTPVPAADGSRLCALASDINQGPVDRAAAHVAAAGLSDRIRTIRTAGLSGLEGYQPTDIAICGMGGELIVSILEAAPWVKSPAVRLILQPMTHPEKVRAFLLSEGFLLLGETLSQEGERIYQTVCACSPAAGTPPKPGDLSPAGLLTGFSYPEGQRNLHLSLIDRQLSSAVARREAKDKAGQDVSEEDVLVEDLRKLRTAVAAGRRRLSP
jgi:tRNA (adenine22-N1)-methyltransferase